MKILCAEYNDAGEVAVVPVGDDVLLRNNGDFYIPDYTQQVSGVPQLVVRICKLGKSVGERFAGRYFEEIGVGVRFSILNRFAGGTADCKKIIRDHGSLF